jgi:Domain of unknown function (DUF4394)
MNTQRTTQVVGVRLQEITMKLRTIALIGTAALAVGVLNTGVATAADGNKRNGNQYDRHAACSQSEGKGRYGGLLNVIGVTADNRLICFSEKRPGKARDIGAVMGLTGDNALVGIDFRPVNGELIGLGNAGGLYQIDPSTAAATKRSQLSVALSGGSFGVDFNPTVDRLRITSDDGQSLRVNVDTGAAVVDSILNYVAGTPATGISGSAYTNNDSDPNTATTLYDIDSMLDQVVIQAPPNAGTLNPTGKLGVDTSSAVGADIYSTVRDGTTVDVVGFASLTTGGQSGFYRIALFSGKVSSRGMFAANNQVIGIAVPLNQL